MATGARSYLLSLLANMEGLSAEDAERAVRALQHDTLAMAYQHLAGVEWSRHCPPDATPKLYRLGWHHACAALRTYDV